MQGRVRGRSRAHAPPSTRSEGRRVSRRDFTPFLFLRLPVVSGLLAAQTLPSASAHLPSTGAPYISRSFSRRIAQAIRNARASPYFLIETEVRPFFSRPAFQET